MDSREQFFSDLTSALATRSENLERTVIVKLRESFQGFEASVSSMYKFLIDKGLMQNDPYKHERTITKIQVPSNDPFTDSEAQQEMSMRFSHYVSQWEFMVNIFHVSVANLDLKTVRRLMDLLDWIRWTDFSVNSALQVTRAMARTVNKVSQMNDPMAGKIISSSAAHLRDLTKTIKGELKILTVYLREHYKWRVRDELVNRMGITPDQYAKNPMNILNNVKFEFSHSLKSLGWYKELAMELLDEDFGNNPENLRSVVLERLKVTEERAKKKKKSGPNDTMILMGVVERLARCSEPIRSSVTKMNENSRTIQERKKSFGEKISEIFSTLFSRHEGKVIYEINIRDGVSGVVRREALDYTRFAAQAMKRARNLQELQDAQSTAYKNARSAGPEQLVGYIEKYLTELKLIHRRLEGLEAYFQSNAVPQEVKATMKASGLNLKNLKGMISETMRSLNEFRVKKEEEAQLKKLGIDE